MKFLWTTIHVNDMEESLIFYNEIVGLPIEHRFPAGPGMEIAFLGNGGTKVELICRKDCGEVNLGKDISLGFSVDSLEVKMAFIKEKGLEIHSGPFQPNPNTRFFFVLDPNGLKIQFVEEE